MKTLINIEFKLSSIVSIMFLSNDDKNEHLYMTLIGQPILEDDKPVGYIREVDYKNDIVKGVLWKSIESEIIQTFDVDKCVSEVSELNSIIFK